MKRGRQAVGRERQIVADAFFLGGAVEDGAQVAGPIDEGIRLGVRLVGLEEHVLVHMREARVFRALRERPVPHVDLDGRQRYTAVLDHDDFESVVQDSPSSRPFE